MTILLILAGWRFVHGGDAPLTEAGVDDDDSDPVTATEAANVTAAAVAAAAGPAKPAHPAPQRGLPRKHEILSCSGASSPRGQRSPLWPPRTE